jgi:MFS family permease
MVDKHVVAANLDHILEQMPMSVFHYRLLVMCGMVFMADAMEVNLLTYMSACAGAEWALTDAQRASIISVVFVGEMCGSAFWGPFADRFGRRKGFLSASVLICAAGFLSAASTSYGWLLFFRMVVGFGVGGGYIPYDLLSEYLPAAHRGDYLTRMQYFWTFGSLFVTGLAWASLSQRGWRFLTCMTAVPVTLACLYSIYALPESPRWLLVRGRIEEAAREVEKLAQDCGVELETLKLPSPPSSPAPGDEETFHEEICPVDGFEESVNNSSYMDVFATKADRRLMLPLSLTWGIFGFTYYGIILYIGRLYDNSRNGTSSDSCTFDYESVFINTVAELLGSFMCIVLVDRIGRIMTQTYLYVLGGVAIALMCFRFPESAAVAVVFIARMSVMAASVRVTW